MRFRQGRVIVERSPSVDWLSEARTTAGERNHFCSTRRVIFDVIERSEDVSMVSTDLGQSPFSQGGVHAELERKTDSGLTARTIASCRRDFSNIHTNVYHERDATLFYASVQHARTPPNQYELGSPACEHGHSCDQRAH